MKIKPLFSAMGLKSLCVAALLLSACGNQREIQQANEAYQRALALDDVAGQRLALLALTRADEDVSENWMQLARIELQMGAYGDAYSHLSRAHELDRTAVPPLSMMTELAVINGRLDYAEEHLKQLMVIAPNDRAVAVARGFVALRQANYERAQENVDILLSQNPSDTVANVLQTRILVAQKKFPEAINVLGRALTLSPNDRAMLKSLGAVHRYLGDWEKAAAIDHRLWQLAPSDALLASQVVTDALRTRDMSLASDVTKRLMTDAKAGAEVDGVLAPWGDPATNIGSASVTPPANMPDHSKIAFAHYLNRTGRPAQAFAILGKTLRPLDDRANVAFNAVFAESLFLSGQLPLARRALDGILKDEPDNAVALSVRARLLSAVGEHKGATIDAQRLVASYGTIAEYRVLLAQTYRASQDVRGAERTLWDGYRDLPGNETLYREVRRILIAQRDKEALSRFESDFGEERFSRLIKELA